MAKSPITITLDVDIAKIARERNINLSGTINRLLHEYLKIKVADLPDKNIKVVCGLCRKEITEGYTCEITGLIFCKKCNDHYGFKICPKGPTREHEHTKWTRETLKK